MNYEQKMFWYGRPVEGLDREELLKVVAFLSKENRRLQQDRDRWRISGSAIDYLMIGTTTK